MDIVRLTDDEINDEDLIIYKERQMGHYLQSANHKKNICCGSRSDCENYYKYERKYSSMRDVETDLDIARIQGIT